MPRPDPQSGNALFYILICIALFAALSYAVSQSGNSGKNISDEKAQLAASEIIQYGNQLREAMVKLRLRGCQENQFDFSNTTYKRLSGGALNSGNNLSPADNSCDLFAGGENIFIPAATALTEGEPANSQSWLPGHSGIRIFQMKGIGTDGASGTATANDIVLVIPYINMNVCAVINQMLNVTSNKTDPVSVGITGATGEYTNGSLAATGIYSHARYDSRPAYCFKSSSTSGQFIQILLAR